MNIKLVLLYNANCYGDASLSVEFEKQIQQRLEYITNKYHLASFTSTSPFVAKTIKRYFPGIEIRASVNMRLGTVKGMEYVEEYFDGYYIQREFNRGLQRIKQLKDWCDNNAKKLYLLANKS